MMLVTVTGAAGFLGSRLCSALLAADHEVQAVDIVHPDEARLLRARVGALWNSARFRYEWGSAGDYRRYAGNHAIIHAAAVTDVRFAHFSPEYTCQRNLEDGLRLLMEADRQGVAHLIVVSSHSVYGKSQPQPIPEDVALRPSHLYGASKAMLDMLARTLYYERDLPVTVVRPTLMYGEGERPGALVSTFIRRALLGQPLYLDGGGNQSRDMNYVDNTVDALLLLLGKPWAMGSSFNVGSGEEVTIRALAEMACRFAGKEPGKLLLERPGRPGEEGRLVLDSSRIMKRGYVPRVRFAEGFAITAAWLRRHE